MHCTYYGISEGTSQAKMMTNSKKIKPLVSAIIELRLSKGINYSVSQYKIPSINKFYSNSLKVFWDAQVLVLSNYYYPIVICISSNPFHLGTSNPGYVYTLNGHDIEKISKEEDFEQLKFHEHTSCTTNKANHTIGIIQKTFTNMSIATFQKIDTPSIKIWKCILGSILHCRSS